jgi:hypothetical protein
LALGFDVVLELVKVGHHLRDSADSGDHDNLRAIDCERELEGSLGVGIQGGKRPIIKDSHFQWVSSGDV